MAKVSEIIEPYFSHDISSRQDRNIILLLDEMGYEGYGLWWAVVEFMHRNQLNVGEERLIAGKENAEKVKKILNDFGLFRIENDEYVSDRILRNINKQKEKSKQASNAAKAKYNMAALKSAHVEVFGIEPVLNDDEVKVFLNYCNKVPDLKDKLCDVLYTVQKLKFQNNPDFKGSVNWLLQENNLSKMLSGGFGVMKNWQKHKDYIAQQNQPRGLSDDTPKESEFDINAVGTQVEAIELIMQHSTYAKNMNRMTIIPPYKDLVEKFDLSLNELKKMKAERVEENA